MYKLVEQAELSVPLQEGGREGTREAEREEERWKGKKGGRDGRRQEGRKAGRKEGRKEGGKEGRKEGRKGGRKIYCCLPMANMLQNFFCVKYLHISTKHTNFMSSDTKSLWEIFKSSVHVLLRFLIYTFHIL